MVGMFRQTIASIIQARAVLGGHARDFVVRVRICPDDVEAVIRIRRRILISKSIDNVRQSIMFPANEDVSGSIVAFHGIGNAVRVIAVAVRVDCEA